MYQLSFFSNEVNIGVVEYFWSWVVIAVVGDVVLTAVYGWSQRRSFDLQTTSFHLKFTFD